MKRTLTLILMLGLLTAAGAKKKQQTATVFDGYLFLF